MAATLLSISGAGSTLCGIAIFFSPEESLITRLLVALSFIAIGVFMTFKAEQVNDNKIFQLWLKEAMKQWDVPSIVATDANFAIAIYAQHPCKAALKYISKYNPEVALQLKRKK